MTPPPPDDNDRRQNRHDIALEIGYRSAGAFLVAYTTNISKGGLFVETEQPLAVGTEVILNLSTPGVPEALALDGTVAWVREQPAAGQPAGMGIELHAPAPRFDELVDEIVARFSGIRILVVTGEPAPRALLQRYLRSILSCEIVELDPEAGLDAALTRLDLAVIDLDSTATDPAAVMKALGQRTGPSSIPVIVLAHDEAARERGRGLGADDVVANPPTFAQLQSAVIRMLGRPNQVR